MTINSISVCNRTFEFNFYRIKSNIDNKRNWEFDLCQCTLTLVYYLICMIVVRNLLSSWLCSALLTTHWRWFRMDDLRVNVSENSTNNPYQADMVSISIEISPVSIHSLFWRLLWSFDHDKIVWKYSHCNCNISKNTKTIRTHLLFASKKILIITTI